MHEINNILFKYTAPKVLELHEEKLAAPGPGEIRCKTLKSLVSLGTELICFERNVDPGSHWDTWVQYPFDPGYLAVGEITDLGEGVDQLSKGQRVAAFIPHRAHFNVNAEEVFPVPEGISDEAVPWFGLNAIVQNGIREADPRLGETAVVIGLGPLGQLAVRILGLTGLKHLVAIDPSQMRCDMAKNNGPDQVWCGFANNFLDQLNELTQGRGAHMVFDITGHPSVFHTAQQMLGHRGRLGLIGDVPKPSEQTMTRDVLTKSVRIVSAHVGVAPMTGSAFYPWGKREMIELFFHWVKTKAMDIDSMTTMRINPKEAPETYLQLLANREAHLGVVVDWTNV